MHERLSLQHDQISALLRRQLFFIGGSARSGTTWLQLMLNAHPEISCRGEGHFLDSLLPLLEAALTRHNATIHTKNATLFKDLEPFPQIASDQGQYLLTAAIALMLAQGAGNAPIVGEKTPDNLLALPKLHTLFPNARFIILVRDGRDCATSAWFHNSRLDPGTMRAMYPRFVDFVDAFASGWATCIDTGLRYAAAHPHACVCVAYEGLVRAPEATLAALLRFLGAGADVEVVRRCIDAASFVRLSGGRRPGEEDRSSLFRRGEIGDWRRHFDRDACAAFERHAGAQLQRCGYPLAVQGDVAATTA